MIESTRTIRYHEIFSLDRQHVIDAEVVFRRVYQHELEFTVHVTEEYLSLVSAYEEELAHPGMACVVLTIGCDIFFGQLVKSFRPSTIFLSKLVVLVAIVPKNKDGALSVRLGVRVE